MSCTNPRTVGFKADGKTISWSSKNFSKEFPPFKLPCGKCLECRLDYAREWAIRSVHEASVHEENSFITLTYSDDNLKDTKLRYIDFQLFAKRLRKHIFDEFIEEYGKINWANLSKNERKQVYEPFKIGIFATGEYGDKNQRPHWHAIIFNWRPKDCIYMRSNQRGDRIYRSETLEKLWPLNDTTKKPNEIGSVTMHSAGYVARYAAKKIVHGDGTIKGADQHEWQPLSKKSSHQAIGKRYLEKYYQDVFNYGFVEHEGVRLPIPRYYEKWLKKFHPDEWVNYVTKIKADKTRASEEMARAEAEEYINTVRKRGAWRTTPATRNQVRAQIKKAKFKQLQERLKL